MATHYDEHPGHQIADGHLPVAGTQRIAVLTNGGAAAAAGRVRVRYEPDTVLRLVRRGDQVGWVRFGRAAVRR
ncbi:hypothetical protein SK571_26455 [Lentzea sp. BCCO 10_0798]|uniref:Uncharacterized protein n=1 Tax=Lentzea kristufekii TaxID=3095430 RepID=A0ABU4TXX9_9PSEU|nr:hypothetical protein [Lentzea sp. BCCO 10_0798]MDX8052933.1 hypothetical protein [Lentzea sp. BCCO 10_0798]